LLFALPPQLVLTRSFIIFPLPLILGGGDHRDANGNLVDNVL
jgi:hypothetical protein